jgi:hypothetical protein
MHTLKWTRINVSLEEPDWSVLVSMANDDCRTPHDQMRFLLREEAKRRGLLDKSCAVSALGDEVQGKEEARNGQGTPALPNE